MEILHLLEKLTQNCGVAGYEKPIADLLEDENKGYRSGAPYTAWQPDLHRKTGIT